MNYPFIVLEGVDGTGKSTVSKLVAEKIGAMRLATPMEPYNSFRPAYSKETWNAESSFDFYLQSLQFASDQIEVVTNVMPLVLDRFVASTFAYHTSNGLDREKALDAIKDANLTSPTIGFQLVVEDAEMRRRLTNRGSRPLSDDWLKKIREAYSLFNYELVDTTTLTPEEVAEHIVNILKQKNIIFYEQ